MRSRKSRRGLLVAAFAVVLGVAARAEVSTESHEQRIVVFKPDTTPADRVAGALQSGGTLVRELRLIDAVVVRVAKSQLKAAEDLLKRRADVLRIDEDPRINWLESRAAAVRDVPLPDVKSFLKEPLRLTGRAALEAPVPAQEIPWGITRVNAAGAWAATKGKGVKVGVIDTGIDYDHPDLKANIAGGWNAVDKTKPNEFKDDNGHGTHVSGTIAALDDNSGVVGVAPEASLYGIKVLDAGGSGTFSDVIAGMEWCVTNKMQVANMSLGASRGNDSLKAAVEAMAKGGVAVIAAAGNSGRAVGYPAAYPQAIAIAASDATDKVAWFSSRGPEVALIAPGVNVKSTYMGGGYDSLSGTSMATPHVAGLAALAVAAKGMSDTEALRAQLKAAATPLPGAPVEQQGAGLINAAKLVQ